MDQYLDSFFQAGASSPQLPPMPEHQPWAAAPALARPSGSRLAAAAADSPAPSPSGQGAAAAGNPFGGGVLGGGAAASPDEATTTGGAAPPAHRRAASLASSHQRTLSNSSDLWGSMPGTPTDIPGPERAVVAAFAAEMEGELSVEPGDRVKVHSEVGGWARVLRVGDRRGGLVPSWAVGAE